MTTIIGWKLPWYHNCFRHVTGVTGHCPRLLGSGTLSTYGLVVSNSGRFGYQTVRIVNLKKSSSVLCNMIQVFVFVRSRGRTPPPPPTQWWYQKVHEFKGYSRYFVSFHHWWITVEILSHVGWNFNITYNLLLFYLNIMAMHNEFRNCPLSDMRW